MTTARTLFVSALFIYGRMPLTVVSGLVTTTQILSAMGSADFGIFSMMSAVSGVFLVLIAAATTSMQRHLAIQVGAGREGRLAATKLACRYVAAALGAGVAVAAALLCLLLVPNLNIPEERVFHARVVLLAYGMIAVTSALTAPSFALYAAHQRFHAEVLLSVCVAFLTAIVATFLSQLPWEPMIAFAVVTALLQISANVVVASLARTRFHSTETIERSTVPSIARSVTTLGAWSFLHGTSTVIRTTGAALVLNLIGGPVANAAFSVALQAATYVTNITSGVSKAVQPALAQLLGSGTVDKFERLTHMAATLSVWTAGLVAVPFMAAPSSVLPLWLSVIPDGAPVLVAMAAASALIAQFSLGHEAAAIAGGKFAHISAVSILIAALAIAVQAILAEHYSPPLVTGLVLLLSTIATSAASIYVTQRSLQVTSVRWVQRALLQGASLLLGAAAFRAVMLSPVMAAGANAAFAAAFCAAGIQSVGVWLLVFDKRDRGSIHAAAVNAIRRLRA